MNELSSVNFFSQNFSAFEISTKKEIYKEANENHKVDLVRQLNDLGMKPEVPSFSSPTIISSFMDIATKYDVIRDFLRQLRQTNRLLTEKEFESLDNKNLVQKTNLNRLLGHSHLMEKINENNLKFMKVPYKIAVIEGVETIEIRGATINYDLYGFDSDQIKIYSEKIEPINRKITRDEIDEFIIIIAISNFTDLWPENIIVAKDGIYFIDTELKSFLGYTEWGNKLKRFKKLISQEDKIYFKEKINKELEKPNLLKENNEYLHLKMELKSLNRLKDKGLEDEDEIKKIERKITALEYVGTSKSGFNIVFPNIFTFKVKDII